MTSTTLTVRQPGITWVQDLGRPGLARLGISDHGAGDRYAATVAAVLVGNEPGTPVLEVTATELSFTVDRPTLVGVTGAAAQVHVGPAAQPVWQTLVVPAGATVTVPAPLRGLRSYVGLRGTLVAATTLGSVAPDPLLGVGTRLAAGDRLELRTTFAGLDHPHTRIPVFRFPVERPALGDLHLVDVTPGPEASEFPEDALAGPWEVAPESDHVGLRLAGEAPPRAHAAEILSRGVPVGAVEIPPSGGLLVLLRGRLVTAGYPVAGVATTVAVDRLAQAGPGDTIRFRPCSVSDGVAQARRQAESLARLARMVRDGLAAAGLAPA